jgi:hypothetical protein
VANLTPFFSDRECPHEYTWCRSRPDQCNMFNNFSYRKFTVSGGPTFFTFSPAGNTMRSNHPGNDGRWPSATLQQHLPDPGNDGIFFVGYK